MCNGVTVAHSACDWRQMWCVWTKTIKNWKQREKHTSTSYEILRWCRWWCQWKIHVFILMSCCRWLQCWCRCPSWCQGSCYCRSYVLVTMPVFMFVSLSELQTQPWQRKGRKGWGGTGAGAGERATELCGWLNFLFSQSCIEGWSDCLFRDESVLTQLLESQGLGCDGAVRHVSWLWRRSDARSPPLPRARITKSCQARRAWT